MTDLARSLKRIRTLADAGAATEATLNEIGHIADEALHWYKIGDSTTFDAAYARHKRGDVTPHHSCSVCYQAGWDAATAENKSPQPQSESKSPSPTQNS